MGATVLRTHLHITLDSTAAPNIFRAGLIVEDNNSLPALINSGPLDNPNRDWFGLVTIVSKGTAALTAINAPSNNTNDYDFRSKRRLTDPSMGIFLLSEYTGAGSFSYTSDILLALA
jgi:hypothetical protein